MSKEGSVPPNRCTMMNLRAKEQSHRGLGFGVGRTLTAAAVLLTLCVCACNRASAQTKAPDFSGADAWLNTDGDKPVSISALKGQVVLLDFWTYCCINCMHIFPDLHYLEHKYNDKPFVVIGVHSGKFSQEKDADNIRQAVLRNNITHPVAVDNEFKIWDAFGVDAWPTLILIDSNGNIAGSWAGEGHRDEIDARIDELLKKGQQDGTLASPIHFKSEQSSFKSGVLEFPGKVLADATTNRLFISDTDHNRILVADLDGKVSQIIGDGQTGLKDGSFDASELRQPQGLALSADGQTLYIADTENHSVRAADLNHKTVTTLAGTGERTNMEPSNSPGKTTPLSSPWDLARVGQTLYVAMAGVHQIWSIDLNKDTVSLYAGTGREGDSDGSNGSAGFAQPSGLATDGKHIYVADSEASSIRSIDLVENETKSVAGSGDLFGFGRQDGTGKSALFQHPLGVALNGADTLFVADTFNGVIRKIDLKTGEVSTWLAPAPGDNGLAADNFYEPGGLSVAGNTLYVADTNHQRIVAIDIATKKASVVSIELPPGQ
jgi:DNA-binding beta-propeller fold protein YncE/peroxiredoxin